MRISLRATRNTSLVARVQRFLVRCLAAEPAGIGQQRLLLRGVGIEEV
ncbi:hypothetical protein [Pseudoclavibacter helvolus]